MQTPNRPNVFMAQNYRQVLGDFYEYEKSTSPKFSYRVFSARAGFKSPNFLKLVVDGKRNLTPASIRAVIKAFKFSSEEGSFFKSLVLMNQATSGLEKSHHAKDMLKSKVFRELYPMRKDELDFYQNYLCIPIREMIASPGFREDPRWIAANLRPVAPVAKVEEALATMLKLELIHRDENGRLMQSQKNLTTGDEVRSTAVLDFHRQLMRLASQSLDDVNRMHRDVSSSTVLISETTFHHLKEMVQNFRKTLLAEAELAGAGKQVVYQINFQLFPLTQMIELPEGPPLGEVPCKKSA